MLRNHPRLEMALSLTIFTAGSVAVVAVLVADAIGRKIGALR